MQYEHAMLDYYSVLLRESGTFQCSLRTLGKECVLLFSILCPSVFEFPSTFVEIKRKISMLGGLNNAVFLSKP